MTKSLSIQCPSCQETSELFLQSRPSMIVLNCPVCQSTLMHLDGQTHQIEDLRIVNLEKHILRQFVQNFREKNNGPLTLKASFPIVAATPKAHHRKGEAIRAAPITTDDLINLRIDLEKCTDVEDFVHRY